MFDELSEKLEATFARLRGRGVLTEADIKEGSWDVMGLRGTASIDYSITDKFVPAHRTFEYPFVVAGDLQKPSAQGLIQRGQPGLAAFASGIGFRALAELVAAAPKTKRLLAEGRKPMTTLCNSGSASSKAGCEPHGRIISISSPRRTKRSPGGVYPTPLVRSMLSKLFRRWRGRRAI